QESGVREEESPEDLASLTPDSCPLTPVSLVDLLDLAAENRRLRAARGEDRLQEELDALHRALARQRGREDERLRAQKLRALAEFAAGAGPQINNPPAGIPGQAPDLPGHHRDPPPPQSPAA